MRSLYTFLFLVFGFAVYSQSPAPFINYQGVARTAAGIPITGPIGVRMQIHQNTAAGTVVFAENNSATTNQFGIFNLQIGSQNTTGFVAIDWSQGPYFLEVSIDPNGGSSYTSIGVQQLVSVPYALYAEKAKNAATTTISATPNVTVTNLGVNNYSLSVPNYVAGSNVTISPLANNNYQIDAGGTSTSSPLSLWASSVNNVYLTNNSNLVGIGLSNPSAKLEVNTTSNTALDAIYATTGTGNGVLGTVASTATNVAGAKGLNSGSGPGVFGANSAGATGVYGENMSSSSSANANGVDGRTNSQNSISSGVLGENYGTGPGVYGYQGNSSSGSSGNGVFGITNSSSSAGVFGTNSSVLGGPGVFGLISSASTSASASGVRGETNALTNLAAGVYGQNKGQGPGVIGINSMTLNSAEAHGVKGITYSFDNGAAGVNGVNNGAGPAVKASLPTFTVAGGINTSLLLENGHIKSVQPNAPFVSTFANSGGISGATYTTISCTDVKGSVLVLATTTGTIGMGGQLTIQVNFGKTYSNVPTVVISPSSDPGSISYFVSAVTPSSFNVTFKNNTPGIIPGFSFNFNFNYFVIE